MDPIDSMEPAGLKMCQKCGKVGSISDHMNETGTIFKWCIACRKRGRARSRLRRQRKKDIIASFQAQAQANPQLTNFVFQKLAASNRSAFSRRDQIRFPVSPPPASTLSTAESTDTLSTSLKTEETESIISDSDQAESSRARERFYSPEQFIPTNFPPSNLPLQPERQLDVDEGSEESLSGSIRASTPTYFFCIHCSLARRTGLGYSDICVYCLEHEQQYCVAGDHEADRHLFTDTDGVEQSSCRHCRERDAFDDEMECSQESDDE